MFFRERFISLADSLQSDFEGHSRPGQNPADKGELCENFIKNFLNQYVGNIFNIYRGGKIINIDEKESKQLDIVLCSKGALEIFRDKGPIFPIETVFGVFSVTANLDHPKLLDCIEEFKSIPKENLKFRFDPPVIDTLENRNVYEKIIPYKCVWAFKGDINLEWEVELNKMVADNPDIKNYLPDFIIVNKKGVIEKSNESERVTNTGEILKKDFHYTDFNKYKNYGACFGTILNHLYKISNWSKVIIPYYWEYFNKDL
jgi:hypothetical protein